LCTDRSTIKGGDVSIIVADHCLNKHTTLMHSRTTRHVGGHKDAGGTRGGGIPFREDEGGNRGSGRHMRRDRGAARRRRQRTESRVDLMGQQSQVISQDTLKANVEMAMDTRRSRHKRGGGGRHMVEEIITGEKQGRLIKRRKDESATARRIIKPSAELLEVLKRETKAIGDHTKTQQELGKDLGLDPPFSEDDLGWSSDGAFAELPKRNGEIRDAHPILDGRAVNAKEKAHGKRKRKQVIGE
jgi:hypothetical protein